MLIFYRIFSYGLLGLGIYFALNFNLFLSLVCILCSSSFSAYRENLVINRRISDLEDKLYAHRRVHDLSSGRTF